MRTIFDRLWYKLTSESDPSIRIILKDGTPATLSHETEKSGGKYLLRINGCKKIYTIKREQARGLLRAFARRLAQQGKT